MRFVTHSIVFLPGASGDGTFWAGVGDRLPKAWQKRYLSWPGLGNQPALPTVNGLGDLLRIAEEHLVEPSVIVAQSMGGIIAIQLALKHPDLVTHLVLVATSGGLDVMKLGASEWRQDFAAMFPDSASWILTERPDLSQKFGAIKIPTLLIWGEKDVISPVAVGHFLSNKIPRSQLLIVPGGHHSVAYDSPDTVAPLIERYLGSNESTGLPERSCTS